MNGFAQTLTRRSNMELLRIVAMFLVLIVHADFLSLGSPSFEDLHSQASGAYTRLFIQSCSIICVNLFILISGYFSITWKLKSFAGFLFQCLFFYCGIYAVMLAFGLRSFDYKGLMQCFTLSGPSWFVVAYIGLYILAPVLNGFAEKCTVKQLRNFILLFYGFQFFYGWLFDVAKDFQWGYSTLSFVGLYMIGRYLKSYPESYRILTMKKRWDLTAFLSIVLLGLAAVYFCVNLVGNENILGFVMSCMYVYNAPNVVVGSVLVFLFFSKLNLRSRAVNWIASSSFAVYLFHCNIFVLPFYLRLVRDLDQHVTPPLAFGLAVFGVACAIFAASVLLDKVRIALWNRLWAVAEKFGSISFTARSGSPRP